MISGFLCMFPMCWDKEKYNTVSGIPGNNPLTPLIRRKKHDTTLLFLKVTTDKMVMILRIHDIRQPLSLKPFQLAYWKLRNIYTL